MIKHLQQQYIRFTAHLAAVFILIFGLSACSLQQVAYFDEGSLQMTQDLSIRVDMFFAKLIRKPKEERTYEASAEEYIEIDVLLNALLVRNQNRQFNELSVEQIQSLVELWQNEESTHKKRDKFPDVLIKLHRQQFKIAFSSIMRSEQYKVNPLHEK